MAIHSHKSLAALLGVSAAVLGRAKADLTPELHYTSTRPHQYTDAGIAFLRSLFGLEKKEGPGPLIALRPKGKRFVVCEKKDGGLVELEVTDPALFSRGFVIPATRYTLSGIRPGYARLKGRAPRGRGRW